MIARTGKECPAHLGATCINILEVFNCPILMVPLGSPLEKPKTIMNPTSGSHFSMSASELAVLVADNFNAELHSLYVGKQNPRMVLRSLEAMAQKLDVVFKSRIAKGAVDKAILIWAQKHDMMVFSRGYSGFKYHMRKVTKKAALGRLEREVIGESSIPMIIVGD